MTKILLDTNAYSGFMSGDQLVFDYIVESEIVYISTIMLGELFAGFQGGNRYAANKNELKIFLNKDGVTIIDVTIETSEIFGEIKAALNKKGKMIPLNDIWIAAHAVETGAKLLTYDTHFKNIDGLRVWAELK
ncbi:MAG: type II toxin-antitoxin system VapC family toxin [Pseudomonadota bacterium]